MVQFLNSLYELLKSGGFAMVPLLAASLLAWMIIIERGIVYWKTFRDSKKFYKEALPLLLKTQNRESVQALCLRFSSLPTAYLLSEVIHRIKDEKLKGHWEENLERQKVLVSQDLRSYLWILATVGSLSPFVGLFGTVIGILRSFHEMAVKGSGGFTVVAGGISESLIATAAGIIVAVISMVAYNIFQTLWNKLVLMIQMHLEEFVEILE